MTAAEAFALLRERRTREIAKGRRVEELSTLELAECLRLHGCRIPRFEGDEYNATMAVYDWLETAEGKREIAQLQMLEGRGNGTVPLSVDGRT